MAVNSSSLFSVFDGLVVGYMWFVSKNPFFSYFLHFCHIFDHHPSLTNFDKIAIGLGIGEIENR
jgi:hypothetical protein